MKTTKIFTALLMALGFTFAATGCRVGAGASTTHHHVGGAVGAH
ncbi:MAG TPA: hypothetical protein VGM90_13220 [Kofleriaceae bacterium]|jgi:hypothetical protein